MMLADLTKEKKHAALLTCPLLKAAHCKGQLMTPYLIVNQDPLTNYIIDGDFFF